MRGECDPKYRYSLFVSHYSLHLPQWKRGIRYTVGGRVRYWTPNTHQFMSSFNDLCTVTFLYSRYFSVVSPCFHTEVNNQGVVIVSLHLQYNVINFTLSLTFINHVF